MTAKASPPLPHNGSPGRIVRTLKVVRGLNISLRWMLGHPIGRTRRTKTLYDFLAWQIKSRLHSGPHVVTFVGPARLLVDRHEHGTTANIYVGIREFESMSLVSHALRPGDTFVDVGANVGTFTVLAAAIAGANVVAVEPVQSAADRLRDNIQLNSCLNLVELHRVAAGAARTKATMIIDTGATNHVKSSSDANHHITAEVEILPLDDIVGDRAVTILKIDVEGFELDVLKGAAKMLTQPDLLAVIIETNGSGSSYGIPDSAILHVLSSCGFHMARYDPWKRALNRTSLLNPVDNTVFVRSGPTLPDRLANALHFEIKGLLV